MKHSGSLKKCGVKPHFFVGKNLSKIFQLSIKPKLVQMSIKLISGQNRR